MEAVSGTAGIDPDGRFVYVVNEEIPEGEEPPDTQGIVLVQNWLSRFGE